MSLVILGDLVTALATEKPHDEQKEAHSCNQSSQEAEAGGSQV